MAFLGKPAPRPTAGRGLSTGRHVLVGTGGCAFFSLHIRRDELGSWLMTWDQAGANRVCVSGHSGTFPCARVGPEWESCFLLRTRHARPPASSELRVGHNQSPRHPLYMSQLPWQNVVTTTLTVTPLCPLPPLPWSLGVSCCGVPCLSCLHGLGQPQRMRVRVNSLCQMPACLPALDSCLLWIPACLAFLPACFGCLHRPPIITDSRSMHEHGSWHAMAVVSHSLGCFRMTIPSHQALTDRNRGVHTWQCVLLHHPSPPCDGSLRWTRGAQP